MPNLEKLNANKEKIINIITEGGPSYPGKISKETDISPLFASAFLAELVSERRLKLSDMKIGSSPLYFLAGQETNLENLETSLENLYFFCGEYKTSLRTIYSIQNTRIVKGITSRLVRAPNSDFCAFQLVSKSRNF